MSQKGGIMKIFGFPPIACPTFKKINSIKEVQNTSAKDVLYFPQTLSHSLDLGAFLQENHTQYAVQIQDVQGFILFANLGAKYALIAQDPLVYQTLAKEYVLDIEVLKIITSQEEIQTYALKGIDGVVFKNLLAEK